MNQSFIDPIIVIGNGIAGTSFARHFRKKSDHPILLISDESDSFFSRTALMYVFMGQLRWQDIEPYEPHFWKKNKITRLKARVNSLDVKSKTINLDNGERLAYHKLIIATGSVPKKIGVEGEKYEGVFSLYHKKDLEDLDGWCKNRKKGVIVGGGLIGVELAEMLRSRNMEVTFLVRENYFWANVLSEQEGEIIAQHLQDQGVNLQFNKTLKNIIPDKNGTVCQVQTQDDEAINCDTLGLTIGVRPNIDFLKSSHIILDTGIVVDDYLATNLPDIYAIGDCAQIKEPQPHRKAIEAVWYTGRMMGETLAKNLGGTAVKYRPSHWFNSSKFFDIEYQTYGQIEPKPSKNTLHFLWQSVKENKSLRLAYRKDNGLFMGISSLGIRLRHEILDQWLTQKINIATVIEKFECANFDPELSQRYEAKIKTAWKNHKNQ